MKKFLSHFALAAVAAGFTGVASATPVLQLTSGATTVTILDQSVAPADGDSTLGIVTWNGNVGGYHVTVSAGTTKPYQGSATSPFMDLGFVISGGSNVPLQIAFSENNFGPNTAGGALATIGGTAADGGSVSYAAYYDAGNTTLVQGTQLTSLSFNTNPFSGSASGLVNTQGLYSLTQVITIVHPNGGTSSGDATLKVPDSGTSVLLLGFGLTSLGLLGRRWRKQSV